MAEGKSVTGRREDLRVEPSRCLRMRFSASRCRRCVDICPHGALTLDGNLAVDAAKCRGCLLCTTVCPVGALEAHGDFFICLAQLSKVPEPVLGCLRSKESSHATLACLGSLAEEHLLALYHNLSGRLTLNLTLCADCPNSPMRIRLEQRLDAIVAAGLSGNNCRIVMADLAEEIPYRAETLDRRSFLKSFRNALFKSAETLLSSTDEEPARRSEYAGKRLPGRRALLNGIRNKFSAELEVRIGKRFDASIFFADSCTKCQGCAAICPTGALKTVIVEESPTFARHLCTGCGLCEEFCLDGAVRMMAGESGS